MLRSIVIVLLGLVGTALLSCSPEKEQPPISYEKMTAVMKDVQLAETYTLTLTNNDSTLKKNVVNGRNKDTLSRYYHIALQHHQLSKEEFFNAVDWYIAHPAHLDSIYKRMLNTMNQLEASLPR